MIRKLAAAARGLATGNPYLLAGLGLLLLDIGIRGSIEHLIAVQTEIAELRATWAEAAPSEPAAVTTSGPCNICQDAGCTNCGAAASRAATGAQEPAAF